MVSRGRPRSPFVHLTGSLRRAAHRPGRAVEPLAVYLPFIFSCTVGEQKMNEPGRRRPAGGGNHDPGTTAAQDTRHGLDVVGPRDRRARPHPDGDALARR
ncbi:hypothetical protein [Ornithinimicrobium kibberense]|uniref:hypothetical protein n=1 Tax=Ornithinimicrobium kibberense TaxID=282060 RepID=UPI00361117E1